MLSAFGHTPGMGEVSGFCPTRLELEVEDHGSGFWKHPRGGA